MSHKFKVGDLVETPWGFIARIEHTAADYISVWYIGRWMDAERTIFQRRQNWIIESVVYHPNELVPIENPELLELVITLS